MPGAGSFSPSGSPAGYDPVTVVSSTQPSASSAMLYDGATRDFPLDESVTPDDPDDGYPYKQVHPVDQRVALIWIHELGSMPSAPTHGMKRWYADDPAKVTNLILADARRALQDLVQSKDIEIEEIVVDTSVRGRIVRQIRYKNLRLPKTVPPRTLRTPV